ncbi:hypothetical protein D3C85_1488720 [compost metagenome]
MMFLRLTACSAPLLSRNVSLSSSASSPSPTKVKPRNSRASRSTLRRERGVRSGRVTLMPSLLMVNTSTSFFALAALLLPPLGLLMAWWVWFSTFRARP